MLIRCIVYFSLFVVLLTSCSTKKNTPVARGYHNMTARFNGYYYSCVNIDDGIFKIENSNKDNFEKLLPVYIYPGPDKVKTTFPEFDKAIKKSSLCIQKHAIKDKKGNEIPTAGHWIDNNWINIGIAQFYKREFFSAIESFEHVIRSYNHSKDKYVAMIWLIKAYNEIGSVSNAAPIISLLKNEKNLPRSVKNELPVVTADYYIRRGQNTEAEARLMEATRNNTPIFGLSRKKRARYTFIIAQLLEQAKDNKRAIVNYKKTIKLKPNYDMIFYSKIRMARLLDVKRNNSEKTKKDLLKMSKEFKNTEYFDVIYFTLGDIEERERNISKAFYYYKRSVQTSVSNPNQKALSYLKLGEISFDQANYPPAEAYYDSAVVTLPKEHPDYKSILARKKTLETLVGYIKIINREDSLQKIAKMSDQDRQSFIDRLIKKKEEDDEAKQRALDAAKNAPVGGSSFPTATQNLGGGGTKAVSFYFYDENTKAFGVSDFTKRWGNRKSEDNWRRSNKALAANDPNSVDGKDSVIAAPKTKKDFAKVRASYMKDLPLTDSMITKSNHRIIKAYYLLGSVYKEDLNNTKKTISTFEELNTRFPDNKYLLNTYYTLYRIYQDAKNQPKADYYKEKILSEFADSDFAELLRNPNAAADMHAKKSEVEGFYNIVYASYSENNYAQSLSQAREGITKFGKNDYLPKFEFIKSLSLGKVKGVDSLERNLKLLVAMYPTSEVTPLANSILLAIKKQRNPEPPKPVQPIIKADTFNVDFEASHFLIAIIPDEPKFVSEFKSNLVHFNSVYYSSKKIDISTNILGVGKQLFVLKAFADAKEAMLYYNNLTKDNDVFSGEVKKEAMFIYPIAADNLPFFYKKKDPEGYKLFFDDHYKKMN